MTARRLLLITVLGLAVSAMIANANGAIAPNDNRHAAGTLSQGTLTVHLEARPGEWQPAGADGPKLNVSAFAQWIAYPRVRRPPRGEPMDSNAQHVVIR